MERFYFLDKWRESFISILFAAVPFLIWDSLVTGKHWDFNSNYILGLKLFDLPLEEIMFFISVPFACLFTWEMVKKHSMNRIVKLKLLNTAIQILSAAAGVILLFNGKGYTGLAFTGLGIVLFYDSNFGGKILQQRIFLNFFILITIFTLIFNGYLTWRPVVTYGEVYQMGFRIFTIPFEDFIFGYSLLILSTSIFEKLLVQKQNDKNASFSTKNLNLKSAQKENLRKNAS
jgi:lycopene cyclase domain-containing protein